eukprot:m.358632 g.358632  ORF g.358632 m.358632 type:complete len:797 (+) comp19947_c0_seq3:43-2433(+)
MAATNTQATQGETPAAVPPRITWGGLLELVKINRSITNGLTNSIPTSFVFSADGSRLYFLGSPRTDSPQQIMVKELNTDGGADTPPRPVLADNWNQTSNVTLSREEQLLRERKRQHASGITSFSMDPASEMFLFPFGGQLYTFKPTCQQVGTLVPSAVPSGNKGAQMDPKLCPSRANVVAFVRERSLWATHLESGVEVRITLDQGELVSCGTPSYIVQEEFDRYTGYWWQPTSSDDKHRLLYERVDDSDVGVMTIPMFNMEGSVDAFRYPQAGKPNSKVSLCLAEFASSPFGDDMTSASLEAALADVTPWAEYIVRCGWTPTGKECWAQVMDRPQRRLALLLIPLECFGAADGKGIRVLFEETSDVWVNVHDTLTFVSLSEDLSSVGVLWASEATGFRHLCLVRTTFAADGSATTSRVPLTRGEWQVDTTDATLNQEQQAVYFSASKDNVMERQFYSVNIQGLSEWAAGAPDDVIKPQEPIRHTTLGWSHTVSIGAKCQNFVSVHSSLKDPHQCTLHSIGAGQPRKLLSVDVSSSYRAPVHFSFEAQDGHTVHGLAFTPPDGEYHPAEQKYPTLLYVYGGPHVQIVTNDYRATRLSRFRMLADLGYVVVMMDCRGSTRRGLAFEGHLRHRMGAVEIADQVEGLEYLIKEGKFGIDPDRIGIHGWSYGGYLSLMGIAQRPDIFKISLAGAPVTTWEAYDTGYTERYMDTPQANPEGYKGGSVLELASQFPDEDDRLLIVHGLIDENVHFNHTALLLDQLSVLGKPYRIQVYPKERHGVRVSVEHFETLFLSFITRHL